MKTCSRCHQTKPLDEFSRHRGSLDGRQYHCKTCRTEWLKKHRAENPEYWREHNRRYKAEHRDRIRQQAQARYAADSEGSARRYLAWRIERDFGLSIEEYDALIAQPCSICGAEPTPDCDGRAGIVLDHCHETKVVRGPLCQLCNTGIGKFADDPDRLRAAADYLERHQHS